MQGQVKPYNRIEVLSQAIKTMQILVSGCEEPLPPHRLLKDPLPNANQIIKQTNQLKQIARENIFNLEFQDVVPEEESKERDRSEILLAQSALICNVMQLVSEMRLKKAFRDADVGSLEKRVIYSSDFLHKLFAYLQHEYGAYIENFPVTVFEKIRTD